jgi:hypothetical protein
MAVTPVEILTLTVSPADTGTTAPLVQSDGVPDTEQPRSVGDPFTMTVKEVGKGAPFTSTKKRAKAPSQLIVSRPVVESEVGSS